MAWDHPGARLRAQPPLAAAPGMHAKHSAVACDVSLAACSQIACDYSVNGLPTSCSNGCANTSKPTSVIANDAVENFFDEIASAYRRSKAAADGARLRGAGGLHRPSRDPESCRRAVRDGALMDGCCASVL